MSDNMKTPEGWEMMKELYDNRGMISYFEYLSDLPGSNTLLKLLQGAHFYGLQFQLMGSGKEGGFQARQFSGKTPPLWELDIMISLDDQTLQVEDEHLLICDPSHPAFIKLKNPGQGWQDAFGESEAEPCALVDMHGGHVVSAKYCQEWTEKAVREGGIDFGKVKDILLNFDSNAFFEDFINATRAKSEGPAFTAKSDWIAGLLNRPEKMQLLTNVCKPAVLDLLIQILDETKACSLAVDECETVASFGINVSMNKKTGDLTLGKMLVYDRRKDIEAFIVSSQQMMLNILGLVKQLYQMDPFFESNLPFIEGTYHLITDAWELSEAFSAMRESLEGLMLLTNLVHMESLYCMDVMGHMLSRQTITNFAVDLVYSVKCMFWPRDAKEWITRKRQSGFPSRKLCEEIASGGIHLVCKTYPGGDEDLDWRLSFSEAEVRLSSERTEKQNFVYFVFKSIFYEQLSTVEDDSSGTSLSSYCVKTIMMWACEKHPAEFWEKGSYYSCVKALFVELEEALRTRHLSNYFLPAVNLLCGYEGVTERALAVVTNIQTSLESYPDIETIKKVVRAKKETDNYMFIIKVLSSKQGILLEQEDSGDLMSVLESLFFGVKMPVKAAKYIESRAPETVFGMDTKTLVRHVTSSAFGNRSFFSIVSDLRDFSGDKFIKTLVYRVLLFDEWLRDHLYDTLATELSAPHHVVEALMHWYLYKLFKCMLSGQPSCDFISISNYIQGHPLLLKSLMTERPATYEGMVEEATCFVQFWNSIDVPEEIQMISMDEIKDLEELKSGTINFLAVLIILVYFDVTITEGIASPSTLAFVAVVKHMQTLMTERMKADFVAVLERVTLQDYDDIDLD